MYIINGKYVDNDRVEFNINDPVINFGSGIFETIKIVDGIPQFLQAHYKRLKSSANYFRRPLEYKYEEIASMVDDLIDKDNFASIKILYAFGNYENYIIIRGRKFIFNDLWLKEGVNIGISKIIRSSSNPMYKHKTINYMSSILEQKMEENNYDIVYFNEKGNISEGSKTNIFFIFDGFIKTPDLNQAILPGVMRNKIINCLLLEGIKVVEGEIKKDDLVKSRGAFVSNSLIGAIPIKKIAGVSYSLDAFNETAKFLKKDGIL